MELIVEPERRPRTAILVSGGMDSATLVTWALRAGHDLHGYFVSAGQNNAERELASATEITDALGVPLTVVEMASLFGAEPNPFGVDVHRMAARGPHEQLAAMTTFTTTMLITAARVVLDGRARMLIGLHTDDLAARPVLRTAIRAAEVLASSAAESVLGREGFRFELPFAEHTAADVVRIAAGLRVDLGRTWSCQVDGAAPCGSCRGCVQRREAFQQAGVLDPTAG